MPEPVVLYEKKDRVAIITFNRPEKMNCYNGEVMALIRKYFIDFRDDNHLLVAILTGTGQKAFCAGADMRMTTPKEGEAPSTPMSGPHWHVGDVRVYKPVIAAINGYCLSGGLMHALSCDIRIAAEHAEFGIQQVRFGISSAASTQKMARCIGLSNATYLSLTGIRISAQEAFRMGIIHKITTLKDLMPAAFDMAELLMLNSPTHIRTRKEHLLRGQELPYDEARSMGAFLEEQVPDVEKEELVRAFFEKRKPDMNKIPHTEIRSFGG
ncbi:MAG: hypothetical protein HW402_824 [Dehalococcoidales bacterium]|nr:hypothetical protein [Dehalococcoidales bacterium]